MLTQKGPTSTSMPKGTMRQLTGVQVGSTRQLLSGNYTIPSRHLTSVGRQNEIDVRLRRHNDVGFRLILKVCLTSKTDVILTSKTDVILTSKTDVILTSKNNVGLMSQM